MALEGSEKRFRHPATFLLIALFIAVFVWQTYLLLYIGQSAARDFILNYAFLEQEFLSGDYYRILTSIFLHGGLTHLLSNSILFYLAGKSLEQKIGGLKLLLLFLLSGIAGSLLTAIILDVGVPAIGASGGVFGILAAASLLVPTRSYLENIPGARKFSVPVIRVVFSIAVIGVYFVFQETVMASLQVYQLVDNNVGHLAHFGGIMIGIAFSFLSYPDESKQSMKYSVVLTGLLLGLIFLPRFSNIWYGLVAATVALLVYWRYRRGNRSVRF